MDSPPHMTRIVQSIATAVGGSIIGLIVGAKLAAVAIGACDQNT